MKFSSLGLCLMFLISACAPDDSNAAREHELADRDNAIMKNSRDKSSRTPPRHLEHRKEQPLKRVDKLDANELRNFLAGKQIQPGGPAGGSELFERDGSWGADSQAIVSTYREGFWDVRLGADGKPELCTTEIRRNFNKLSEPQTVCRKISVSLHENRAELEDTGYPPRKYEVTISNIEN